MNFKKLQIFLILTFFSFGSIFISCDFSDKKRNAEQKVLEFRRKIKQQDYAQIYEQAHSKFKKSVNKDDFVSGLSRIGFEIAEPDNFVLESSKVSTDLINGNLTILIYKPKTEGKIVLEEYVFASENDDLLLFNYRIDTKK